MSHAIASRPRGGRARNVLSLGMVLFALLSRSALATVGPTSKLYITNYGEFGGSAMGLDIVQGLSVSGFPTGNSTDICIATAGDVRTFGYSGGDFGSRFNLAGSPLPGGPYTNPGPSSQYHDGTSDGTFNYTVDWPSGKVLRFSSTWASPSTVFIVPPGTAGWITMNAADGTFWLSDYGASDIVEHHMATGALISYFNSGISGSQGLALDPIDGTLWMSQGFTLYQFSQLGVPLQSVNYGALPGQWYGMEFDTTQGIPEPTTAGALVVTGIPLWLRRRRRSWHDGSAASKH